MKYLNFIILTLFFINSFSQDLSIKGNVELIIDDLHFSAKDAYRINAFSLDSNSSNGTSEIDTNGNFWIHGLSIGKYNLKIEEDYSFGEFKKYVTNTDTNLFLDSSITNLNLEIKLNCILVNSVAAKRDINKNQPALLLIGSIAPVFYKNQGSFEKKFQVDYLDYGCTVPDYIQCISSYNFEIFKYLDKKYGFEWRKEVRDDVIGLNYYLEQNK